MKRFISVLAFVLLFATIFSKSVFAQTQSATPSPQTDNIKQQTVQTVQYPINTNPEVPQNFSTYTQSVVLELLSAFSCQISGINPLNPEGQCLGPDPKTGKLGFVDNKGGAIGFLTDSINMTFQIPVSSGQYIATLTDRFGIAKPVLAQAQGGYGFNALLPVLPLWEAIRNIVYIFFVLIFVFIGVGIMFRLHIDPRTVMTIQNSLPKIVMGLVFVTLSYAIAGFLVDMMYVSLYFTHGVVKSAAPNSKGITDLNPQFIQGTNPLGAVGEISGTFGLAGIVTNATSGVVHVIKSVVGLETNGKTLPPINSVSSAYSNIATRIKDTPVFGGIIPFVDSYSFIDIIIDFTSLLAGFTGFKNATQILSSLKIVETTPIVGGLLSGAQSAATFGASALVGGSVYAITQLVLRELLPNLIAFFIILGIVITALFRLWFTLIKAYLYILLHVVLAPFWIAFGLIPGVTSESVGFKPWIRGLIANLAVFPVTYAMILFAKLFLENIKPEKGGFVPPLIGTQDVGAFGSLFAIGVLLAIPEILNMVKKALKVPEGKLGQGISGAIGIGTGLTKAATAPATTRLIGHKNPMTGEFEGGLIPQAGKAAGRNIATGIASTGSKILPSKVSSGFGSLGSTISGGWKKYVAPTPHQAAENRRQEAINQQGNNLRLEGLTNRITDNKDVAEQQIRGDLIADAVKNHGITPEEAEEMKTMSEGSLMARMRDLGSNTHNVKSIDPFQQRRDDLKAIAIRMQIKNANTMTSSEELLSAIREKLGIAPTQPVETPPTAESAPSPETASELTQEAIDLIAGAKTGSIPAEMTDEIRNILKNNGISEDDINTKQLRELIDALASRAKDTDAPTA